MKYCGSLRVHRLMLGPSFKRSLSNTTRLCDANIAALFLYDGEFLTPLAQHGTTPEFAEFLKGERRLGRETPTRLAASGAQKGRHVLDLLSGSRVLAPCAESVPERRIFERFYQCQCFGRIGSSVS